MKKCSLYFNYIKHWNKVLEPFSIMTLIHKTGTMCTLSSIDIKN